MKTATSVLRQPHSLPESCIPGWIEPLKRPKPIGRAVSIAFLRWEKKSLEKTEQFWRDFGFYINKKTDTYLEARAAGSAPCVAMASKGSENKFLGLAFQVSDDTSLKDYIDGAGAQWIDPQKIPGGGQGVELFDPSGRSVWLLQGQASLDPSRLSWRELSLNLFQFSSTLNC